MSKHLRGPSTSERGYGTRHQRLRKRWDPYVATGRIEVIRDSARKVLDAAVAWKDACDTVLPPPGEGWTAEQHRAAEVKVDMATDALDEAIEDWRAYRGTMTTNTPL